MKGKLKQREETKYIIVVFSDMNGRTLSQLDREFYMKGYLYPPFHTYVNERGEIEEARPMEAVGSSDIEGNLTSIYILVDSPSERLMTYEQVEVLHTILDYYQDNYPTAEIVYKKGLDIDENI